MAEYLAKTWEDPGPPPEGLGADDLAIHLLRRMGIAWTVHSGVIASEALRIKAFEPNETVSTAYMFILKRWDEYRASEHYRSQFRRKGAAWLAEGDYNNPASWGDFSEVYARREAAKPKPANTVEVWAQDKRENPEKYSTTSPEAQKFFSLLNEVFKGKRMPNDL